MSDNGIVMIHGKAYETVALRVKKFREKYPLATLQTEILHRDQECVVMKATIMGEGAKGNYVIATGHSEEYRKASQINKTSALENAETSAIGRALAAFGLGGTEFATADEVANAIGQQKASVKSVASNAWDELSVDEQTWLGDLADNVKRELEAKGGAAALKLLEGENLDADRKVAIWSRFSSAERSAMKKKDAA